MGFGYVSLSVVRERLAAVAPAPRPTAPALPASAFRAPVDSDPAFLPAFAKSARATDSLTA